METSLEEYKDKRSVSIPPLFLQSTIRDAPSRGTEKISTFRKALPQFIAVSIKNILLFVYGMTLGFPTIVIPSIQGGEGREPSDIILNRDEISWFSSINLICVPLGCLFSGIMTQPIGKRKAMQFVNLPILGSWLLFHFATSPIHLYIALCLSGLGGGLMEAPVLTYVAEITEPNFRGILSALGSTCVITGIFIQFILGSLLDWRSVAAVSAAFPLISIIALYFVPESPTWLIRKHRFKDAIKALQWLRGWVSESQIEEEFNQLYTELILQPSIEEAKENMDHSHSKCFNRFRMFRKRSFLIPFLLVAYTFFTGHFSGKTPLQTYAVQIFHSLKAPINKYHATILLGVAEMVATILCVILIHFTGKRPLVLISTIGVGVCFFGTATYAHFLQVIPGFVVNNVVANATFLASQNNIVSQNNITKLFAEEEKMYLSKVVENFADELEVNSTIMTEQMNLVDRFNRSQKTNLDNIHQENTEDIVENWSSLSDGLDRNGTVATSNIQNNEKDNRKSQNEIIGDILLSVPKQENNYLAWVPLILLLGSAFFAHLGIRMIPWILIGEVFPAAVRSTASGLVSGIGYIFGFLANKLFLQMIFTFTMPGTFWIYSIVSLTGAIVLYFILPETEGRSLSEIESHFSKKSPINLLKTVRHSNGNLSSSKQLHGTVNSDLENKNSFGETNFAYENNTTRL